MKPKYIRLVPVFVAPIGHYRSLPAEIGSASPLYPVPAARPLEHPQVISTTVDVGIPPMEPANDSTLATEYPPEQLAGRSEPSG